MENLLHSLQALSFFIFLFLINRRLEEIVKILKTQMIFDVLDKKETMGSNLGKIKKFKESCGEPESNQ
jgi:hypothetical protein